MRQNIFTLDNLKKKNVSTNQNLRIEFDLHELIIFSKKERIERKSTHRIYAS